MRAYKFRIYPSKVQEKQLIQHLWIEKNLWNSLVEKTKKKYAIEGKFMSMNEMSQIVKGTQLYSQSAQSIFRNLDKALKAKFRARAKGKKWGFPRFKNIDRIKSIHYPQYGFKLGTKLKVTPFGELNIKQHRIIKGTVKTLCLKRESSNKWYAIFTAKEPVEIKKLNNGPAIGLDLGLVNLAAISDGTMIKNPHQFRKLHKELAFRQKEFSRKIKGSENRNKAKKKVAKVYEKIANVRSDHLHKVSNQLLSSYSKIAMEELKIREMMHNGHGKGIGDASWGILTNMFCYKAESAGSEIVFVNPHNTSKICSGCGEVGEKKSLWERIHNCDNCGLVMDRDTNAAINILARATAGIAGSQACGDGLRLSEKQETKINSSSQAQYNLKNLRLPYGS
jgi:putative transposase